MCGQPLMVIKFYYPVSSYNALYHHKNKLNHDAYVSNISYTIFDILIVKFVLSVYIYKKILYITS